MLATRPIDSACTTEPSAFLDRLVTLQFLDTADADLFEAERLPGLHDRSSRGVGLALVQAGLLTRFQLDNVLDGTTYGLVVGNYRVLDKLGSGGMGDVFLAEHRLMKRLVAIKTMPVDDDCPPDIRQRFYAEMRALAELQHPNIVTAFDAGELASPRSELPDVIYLVMEYLAGGDLDRRVVDKGALPVAEACGYIRQAALGLQAAHDVHLVHRDLKPSNLLLTTTGQVKLVDFGLARQFASRMTDPRALLGSVEYMPPEQSHDPSAVGKPADMYGLGATLYWLLTGEPPYPPTANVGAALRQLRDRPPERVRVLRPDVPVELDALIERMLQRNPALRPQPLAVAQALEAFLGEGPARRPSAVLIAGQLREVNAQLRQSLGAREDDVREAHRALLFAMARMGESRDGETAGHLHRLREYTLVLAHAAARLTPAWTGLVDDRFLNHLRLCVPLHDIGKIGLPDEVLRKPAALTDAERRLVEQHSLIGDRMLESLAKEHGGSLEFLGAARGIVRSHHERWDGAGYPDGLRGESIPAAARLTAVADVYDALRRKRRHKPALTHAEAVDILLSRSEGQFDPLLVRALERCHVEFERIYREIGE